MCNLYSEQFSVPHLGSCIEMRAVTYVGLLFQVSVVYVQFKQTWHVQADEVQHPTVEFCTSPFSGCRVSFCGLTDIHVEANA